MDSYGKEFLLAFLPLFVAIDPLGNLPIVLGVTKEMNLRQRLRVINIAIATALVLGLAFLFLGKALLRFLDIEVEHFAIAGGLVLLVVSIRELIGVGFVEMDAEQEMMAVVPIGTPLLAGPAVLASLLLLNDQYSEGVVVPAFLSNMFVAFVIFGLGNVVAGVLGKGGLRAISKVAALLLSAIAVRLIVVGIDDTFSITT
ncbi:MAG: MarC family protein [Chloroflexi bacterium]|nr:MarC family protein [Chloroflexota bacterium]